jgi:hypothetical protein
MRLLATLDSMIAPGDVRAERRNLRPSYHGVGLGISPVAGIRIASLSAAQGRVPRERRVVMAGAPSGCVGSWIATAVIRIMLRPCGGHQTLFAADMYGKAAQWCSNSLMPLSEPP